MTRRLPGEFEPHEATLLAFPATGKDWPGKFGAVRWAMVEFIRKLAMYEPVLLLVRNANHQQYVHDLLLRAHADVAQITYLRHPTNRSWMRDSGPILVQTPTRREAIRFQFDAWSKYDNYKRDRKVPALIADHLDLPLTKAIYQGRHVVLEGGAIDSNGQGTLLTTEECLLHPEVQIRNPGFSRADYEAAFAEYLGIDEVLWLGDGIEGDDTHGHVDDICRFVNPHTVVLAHEPNGLDYNHHVLENNYERLQGVTLANGRRLDVVRLPMPARIDFEDMRIPASYANFLMVNNGLLVPTFNDPNDYIAMGILRELCPDRTVTGIHCTDLVWGLGTLHCLSHEIPQG